MPHLSITAFARALAPLAGKKRQADEVDEYDSEEIEVAPAHVRPALQNIAPSQVQNKRLRVLDCVLIPVEKRTRNPSGDGYLRFAQRQIHVNSSVKQQLAATTATHLVDKISEDELAGPSQKPQRITKAPKIVAKDDSDFEATTDVSDEEFIDENASDEESSITSVDGSFKHNELSPKKRSGADRASKSSMPERWTKATGNATSQLRPSVTGKMRNLLAREDKHGPKGVDTSLPPIHKIEDMFADLTARAFSKGLSEAMEHFKGRPLVVGTMCSGTDAPILALEEISNWVEHHTTNELHFEHAFSAEVEAFKQAFLEKTYQPPVIFRDVVELIDAMLDETPMATNAYGAKVPVRTHIDILIAGTSCKDFSKLNKNKKTLSDDGESAETWKGVKSFVAVAKPLIVILENVKGAPWERMMVEYEEIGYETAGVHVDTKNFYLPQTRQRGYMVCFDKIRMEEVGLASLGSKWQTLMKDFQRHASCDVSSFLMPTDQIFAKEQTYADETKRDHEWTKCAERHVRYREAKRLGSSQPVTNWQESGTARVPENGSASWYNLQVERVWDVLDCIVLRKALQMYDTRFKTRVIDVSQNVDMTEDTGAAGIVGCITPTGSFFVTDAGRVMVPEELLMLQGIPPIKITLTTETPREIQDLAGNAMTSTAVGAAILSALIAGARLFKSSQVSLASDEPPKPNLPMTTSVGLKSATAPMTSQTTDVDLLLDIARKAARRCLCEGGNIITRKYIQVCFDCHHTTCTSCGGDPEHNYQYDQSLSQGRISPQIAEKEIRSRLPLCVTLGSSENVIPTLSRKLQGSKVASQYVNLVSEASKGTFTMQKFRRKQSLTVTYESQLGRSHVDLILHDHHAEWHFFVHAPGGLAANDPLRKTLEQPVAKARVSQSLFGNDWKWLLPVQHELKGTITGHGGDIPIWQARMEMPDFRANTQFRLLTITLSKDSPEELRISVEGTYQYLPRCGTACESLYKKVDDGVLSPMFLFLNQSRVGDVKEDSFVFSTNPERLDYGEVRSTVASIKSSWRPWTQKKPECTVPIHIDSQWVDVAGDGNLQPQQTALQLRQPRDYDAILPSGHDCYSATELITCGLDASTLAGTEFYAINSDDPDFISKNLWLFENMRRHVDSAKWHSLVLPEIEARCHSCSPESPKHQWRLGDDGDTILPYEEPRSAAQYEKMIKQRPQAIVVEAHMTAEGRKDASQIRLGVNLVSMAHRVIARLPRNARNVSFSWKLGTDFNPSSNFSLSKFNLKPINDVNPFKRNLNMTVDLFPNQSRAVEWMRRQELGDGREYVLEASDEERFSELGWALTMRAQTPIYVRGGIEASHPGFGKTISSLALIQAQLIQQSTDDIISELQGRTPDSRLRISAATLVICPRTLVDQWQEEAQEKLGLKGGAEIFTIKSAADLDKKSLDDFSRAKLIIVSTSVLRSDSYTERLAAFVAQPGPAANKGRAFDKWHGMALQMVPSHLRVLQDSGIVSFRERVQVEYKQNIENVELKVEVPSRRLRGKDYVSAQKAKSKTNIAKTAACASLDTSTLGSPLLEMFYFNRVICDEFHDYEARDFAIVKALKEDKIWGLSGTPAISDFFDVSKMAELLGIRLPLGTDAKGVMKPSNIREYRKEKTEFERFNAMRQKCSDPELVRLQEKYQQFLDAFVTRNVTDYQMPYDEHIKPVTLDLVHQAMYKEASQHLNSIEMRLKSSRKSKTTDREKRLNNVSASSGTAEEVLSKMAVHCDQVDTSAQTMTTALPTLISLRYEEMKAREEEVQEAINKAEKEERVPFAQWRQSRLHFDVLGDEETVNAVKQLCTNSDAKNATIASTVLPDKTDRSQSSKINTMVNGILVAKRSLRYVQNVQLVQQTVQKGKAEKVCSNADCKYKVSDTDIGASALCGHTICRPCFEKMKDKADKQCHASGCRASVQSHHLLWKSKMGDLKSSTKTMHGAKIDATMELLGGIRKQGDQAIIFVQYERQLQLVGQALEHNGISATVIDQVATASKKIAEFKSKHDDLTVIVLNASDETATGLNLQNANHVIFLSPLLRDQQYDYDATMAQAIGRVRRHGQKKQIHVYRIIALDTIDVDILEHRERGNTAATEIGALPIEPPSPTMRGLVEGEAPVERKQLVRENGVFSLRPQSWLVRCGADTDEKEMEKMRVNGGKRGNEVWTKIKGRILGWEDFSSLIKFSRTFTEEDE